MLRRRQNLPNDFNMAQLTTESPAITPQSKAVDFPEEDQQRNER